MSSLRSSLRNASWLVSDRVIRMVLNFAVSILIARRFGPEGFGLLSYGQVVMMILLPLASFGLPDVLVRELARSRRDPDVVLWTAFLLRLGLAVLAFACVVAVGLTQGRGDPGLTGVLIAYGLSFLPQAFDVIESRAQAVNRVGVISSTKIVVTIVFSAIRLAVLWMGAPLLWFAALFSLEVLASGLLLAVVARRQGFGFHVGSWDGAEARLLIRYATPLMFRLLTIAIYMRVDQILIKRLLGTHELGLYSASVRLSEIWYFIPTALIAGAAGNLTRSYERGGLHYERDLLHLMRLLTWLSLAVAVFFSIASPLLIRVIFGQAYAEAASLLAVQGWAGVFVALGTASSPWFINTGQMRFGLYQAVAGALVSVGLNLLLIPRYGLMGAAVSLLISYGVSAVFLNLCFRETRPLFRLQMRAFLLR